MAECKKNFFWDGDAGKSPTRATQSLAGLTRSQDIHVDCGHIDGFCRSMKLASNQATRRPILLSILT